MTIHLDMVRVTEAAAIAASAWVGRGDKIGADAAATNAMRDRLNKLSFRGKIAIGEGKKDNAPGLFHGEFVGIGTDVYDLAVDPLDGTTQTAKSGPEAMSVLALTENDGFYTSDQFYMRKLAFGPEIDSKVSLRITDPLSKTLKLASLALHKEISRLTVCLLDRPRHSDLIDELRNIGVRIKLIQDCDVSAAIATAMPDSGIDLYLGTGGTPEGVITAAAMKCLRGQIQGQICNNHGEILDEKVLYNSDLVRGNSIFSATGVTDGSLLRGVRYYGDKKKTHSVLMRSSSGTVRFIETWHGN